MSPKVRTSPRKIPRQERSRATVEAILDAAAHVLVKEGIEHATTNRIAEVAGVSIGSLYQYFPSKDALISSLLERHNAEMREAVLAELARVQSMPLDAAVRAMVELVVRAHAVDPELHRVLMEQLPRAGRGRDGEFEIALRQMIVGYFEVHRHRLRVADLELATFLAAVTVEAVAHGAVIHHPEHLDDPKFLDEATALVVRYLMA
jgi:AcrR family transcriptional regulator